MSPAPEEGSGGEVPSVEDIVLSHVGQITELQEGMQTLVEMIDDLLAVPPKTRPAPWNWKELNGPGTAKLMQALGAWVDWVNERYGVTDSSRILGCWYLHTAVVEELTAAWVAWQAAYNGHKKRGHGRRLLARRNLLAHARTHQNQTLGLQRVHQRRKPQRPSALLQAINRSRLHRLPCRPRSCNYNRIDRSRKGTEHRGFQPSSQPVILKLTKYLFSH